MLPDDVMRRDNRVILSQYSHRVPGVTSSGAWIETLLHVGLRLVRSLDVVIARLEEWQQLAPRWVLVPHLVRRFAIWALGRCRTVKSVARPKPGLRS